PSEVSRESVEDWDGNDLGKFIGMELFQAPLYGGVIVRSYLYNKQLFISRPDLSAPAIYGSHRRQDIHTGSQALLDQCRGHTLGQTRVRARGQHDLVAASHDGFG